MGPIGAVWMDRVIPGAKVMIQVALLFEGSFGRPVAFELEPRISTDMVPQAVGDIIIRPTDILDIIFAVSDMT